MDSRVKLYLERAENELRLARAVFNLSSNENAKIELEANPSDTFYSAVISHCYYSIFHCAKAYLFSKNIKVPEQGQHQAVYFQFRKLVKEGVIGEELLDIYEDIKIKAETLLEIFESERDKRTFFTYVRNCKPHTSVCGSNACALQFRSITKMRPVTENPQTNLALQGEVWDFRAHFSDKIVAQANIEPANESIENTIKFIANIKAVLEK